MAAETRQVQIGFSYSLPLTAKLDDKQLQSLRKAIEKGEGWWEAETPDGTVALDATQVVFVRVDSAVPKIGFGAG